MPVAALDRIAMVHLGRALHRTIPSEYQDLRNSAMDKVAADFVRCLHCQRNAGRATLKRPQDPSKRII
jgi:hypothetical protein